MVKYQFEIEDDTWERWKETVPRTKPLDQRLIELIEADTKGRIQEAEKPLPTAPDRDEIVDLLEDVTFPSTVDRADAIDAIQGARHHLDRHKTATMRSFVKNVMPNHPLGYDSDAALEKASSEGERYRGSWWRKVVKPGLEALPDVDSPGEGGREWKIIR